MRFGDRFFLRIIRTYIPEANATLAVVRHDPHQQRERHKHEGHTLVLNGTCPRSREHALHRYMLACPLQARATCPRIWWTRPTHPEPPSMPPPTHRHQFLVLVLVPVLNTPRLWLCGLSSEECRSLREIRAYHRSQPGQASMGTESVCAKSE